MSYSLNTNAASANIVANIAISQTKMHKAMEQASSGLRVVNAADDAAGMALHGSLEGQIKAMQAATRNAQDGVSILQTADGALAEITQLVQRAYQVALALENTAANPSGGDGAVAAQAELDSLNDAISFIMDNTYWGDQGNTVLDSAGALSGDLAASAINGNTVTNSASGGYSAPTIADSGGAYDELSTIAELRAQIGGTQAELEGIIASNTVTIANLQASDSRVADADMPSVISDVVRLGILGQAGNAMLAQANQANQAVLRLLQ
jgi:flagellin